MQKILMSTWVALSLVIFVSVAARAQESHPMYDNEPFPGAGSRPIYDAGPTGDSHPIYDNTLPPTVGNGTGVGRSINNLQSVISDLNQTPPDVSGRRNMALQHAAAALQELQDLRQSGQ